MQMRDVDGNMHNLDGTWQAGDHITYRLERVGFDLFSHYMPSDVTADIDADGTIETVSLWASAGGGRNILVILPNGSTFRVGVPVGTGTISLETLHALYSTPEPSVPPSLLALLGSITIEALGANLVGYVPEGATTGLTVRDKLRSLIATSDNTGMAVLLAAATGKTLIVDSDMSVSSSITIPSSVGVEVKHGGKFTVATGQTLTIDGPFSAGRSQVFDGPGTVTGTPILPHGICPEWFGAVADDSTDCAPAFTQAIGFVTGDEPVTLSLTSETYRVASVLTVSRSVSIQGNGAVIALNATQLVWAAASGVVWDNVTFFFDTSASNSQISLFKNKTVDVDPILSLSSWRFRKCVFDGVTPRFTRVNRTSAPLPIARTSLRVGTEANDTVLDTGQGDLVAGYTYVRTGPVVDPDSANVGLYLYGVVQTISDNLITLTAPIGDVVLAGSRVSGVTRLDGAQLSGASSIVVESTFGFVVGNYVQVYIVETHDVGVIHQAVITSINTGTRTIGLGTPLPQDAADNVYVAPMTAGTITTGTDIVSAITFDTCEIKNSKTNYALELGGIDDAQVHHCHIHDIFTYRTAGDPSSGYNTSLGECIKVTAGSTIVRIEQNLFEDYCRDGIDCFDAGNVLALGNVFRRSIVGKAMEAKWNSTDTNDPQPITFSSNFVSDMPGHGATLGGTNIKADGNTIWSCDGSGLYFNGGRPDNETSLATTYVSANDNTIFDCSTGINVAEVIAGVLTGNSLHDNVYGMVLGAYASNCVVAGNNLTGNSSRGLRVYGSTGTTTGHRIFGNVLPATNGIEYYNGEDTGISVNGYGQEAGLVAGASPTASLWRPGDLVRNTTDDRLYLRRRTDWSRLMQTSELPTGASYFVPFTTTPSAGWTGVWDGTATYAVGAYTIDTSAVFGIPANVKAVKMTIRCRWSAASTSNTLNVAAVGGASQVSRHAVDANQNQYINTEIICDANGDITLTFAGAVAADLVYARCWGYYL